jgi:hypothetical protein
LITDGKITARTRCGNQVSVLPQARTAPDEPLMAELDRPDSVASGTEFPSTLNSDLLQVDPAMPIGPDQPLEGHWLALGPWRLSCHFLWVFQLTEAELVFPPRKITIAKRCRPRHSPPPPSIVPDPGTVVLVLSGAAAVFARFRLKRY